MGKAQIIIAAILFFSLATTAFILTLIEFVNMDKNPDKYRNPRYNKKFVSPKQSATVSHVSAKNSTISSTTLNASGTKQISRKKVRTTANKSSTAVKVAKIATKTPQKVATKTSKKPVATKSHIKTTAKKTVAKTATKTVKKALIKKAAVTKPASKTVKKPATKKATVAKTATKKITKKKMTKNS